MRYARVTGCSLAECLGNISSAGAGVGTCGWGLAWATANSFRSADAFSLSAQGRVQETGIRIVSGAGPLSRTVTTATPAAFAFARSTVTRTVAIVPGPAAHLQPTAGWSHSALSTTTSRPPASRTRTSDVAVDCSFANRKVTLPGTVCAPVAGAFLTIRTGMRSSL